MKTSRIALTVFAVSCCAVLVLNALLASAMPPGGGGGPKSRVPHDVVFSGDIQGVFTVDMDPNDPFKNFEEDVIELYLPLETNGVGCPDTVEGWGGYGDNDWLGWLKIHYMPQIRSHHVVYQANSGAFGYINLSVKRGVQTSNGDTTTLTFTDIKGAVGPLCQYR